MDNFRRELDPERYAAELSRKATAMRRDLADAQAYRRKLEGEIDTARREIAKEREHETRCRHREMLARRIDDLETARIAAEFASRHAERARVLQQKLDALTAELALHQRELAAMQGAVDQAAPDPRATAEATLDEDRDDTEFQRLEDAARERAAEARLEELKRKLRL